jgi:hypothetical protein
MPRRRILSVATQAEALRAAGECRALCVRVLTEAPVGGPVYLAAQQVLVAIDGLAEAITGSPDHFHLGPMPDLSGPRRW